MFFGWLYFLLDLLPFLPFWWLLALLWTVLALRKGKGNALVLPSLSLALLFLALPLWLVRPKASLICLGIVFIIYLFSLGKLFFLARQSRLTPEKKLLYSHQKWLTLFALLGAVVIGLIYHQPEILVWRLEGSPSALVEKWLAKNQPRNLNALISGLKGANEQKTAAIFRILAHISETAQISPEISEEILAYLNEQRGKLSIESLSFAINLIENLKLKAALAFLIAESRNLPLPDKIIYPQLLEIFKALSPVQSRTLIKSEFKNSPENSGVLLKLYGDLGGKLSAQEIAFLNHHPSAQTRAKLLEYFAGKAIFLPQILNFLKDPDPNLKCRAIEICGEKNLKLSVPSLLPLLLAPELKIRSRANSVLINLTESNVGYNLKADNLKKEQQKWINWLNCPRNDFKGR